MHPRQIGMRCKTILMKEVICDREQSTQIRQLGGEYCEQRELGIEGTLRAK
jgi:hypothetical protein